MKERVAIVGGGAAGYFAALRIADLSKKFDVVIFEAGSSPLSKVRISGGGRCNVTHACFDAKLLVEHYPRGAKELRGPFTRFQPRDVVEWFESRGVKLKTEEDGRMFPETDRSETIIDCLEKSRTSLGIELRTKAKVKSIARTETEFELSGQGVLSEKFGAVVIASGSAAAGYRCAQAFGHSLTPLAPSLFTFKVDDASLTALSGVSVPDASLRLVVGEDTFSQRGPLLVTHWGLSGPAVIKLSAWAARELQESNYHATLFVNWLGDSSQERLVALLQDTRVKETRKTVEAKPISLPQRLWERALQVSAIDQKRLWGSVSNQEVLRLAIALTREEILVTGKGEFKEEFVTCGGVSLREIDFKTMESLLVPNLYLAGEILDIDGITGGFNFQSAWTTGWLAGSAIALKG